MPGNKNSGRKKKEIVIPDVGANADDGENDNDADVAKLKRSVGRPKKETAEVITVSTTENLVETAPIAPRTKQNVTDLSKRSSTLSNLYTEILGTPLQTFPSSKLPLKRAVLRRYIEIRSHCHKRQRSELIGIVTKELLQLWENSAIPCDTYRGACKVVENLVIKWLDANEEQRKSTPFQTDLNQLLDIRPRSLQILSALKSNLQSSGNAAWLSDYNFFKGQCMFPQTTTMSHTVDGLMQKKLKEKTRRETNRQSFAQKNACNFPGGTSTIVSPPQKLRSVVSDVIEENILPRGPRQSAATARDKNSVLLEEEEDVPTVSRERVEVEEPDWELPPREKRRLRKRPETITLTLPAKKLPTILAKTSVVTNLVVDMN